MTIASRKTFDSVAEGLRHIEQARETGLAAPSAPTKGLLLGAIVVCETVFQRRDTLSNRHGRNEHVGDLRRAIQEDPEAMEPVDVWWGGDGWYLLDGHHRVLAYEALKFPGLIPVRVVGGTLDDALAHVGKANTRNKLPMTRDERNNLAIFYICRSPEKSYREIARLAGVGKSSVGKMKEKVDKVVALGNTRESLLGTSWHEIQRMARGDASSDYDYEGEMLKTVHEIRQALGPVLGKNPQRHVEAMAIALEQLSPALYRGLMDWGNPGEDLEDDLEEDVEY